jgi:hypothetical protein
MPVWLGRTLQVPIDLCASYSPATLDPDARLSGIAFAPQDHNQADSSG